jgi:hypothetical protein
MATFALARTPATDEPDTDAQARGGVRVGWIVALVATAVSIGALLVVSAQDGLLSYFDTTSHMAIARRVLDNSSGAVSLAQLGGVWLPLPHLLMLPFVWNDDLYCGGLAGSIPSMAAFVATCVYLYALVGDLTGSRVAAVVAALAFMANPNVLWMQSIPMTELLLSASIAATAFYVQRWVRTDRWGYLVAAGVAINVGCLTRYEAWVVFAGTLVAILVVLVARRVGRGRAVDLLLAFGLLGGVSIALWLLWNQLIFDNALNWQTGDYAKPSLWIGDEAAIGDWGVAAKTYLYAILDCCGPLLTALGGVGLVVALVRVRTRLAVLPTLASLALIPFFVVALERGQRPLHVEQITGDLYNVRFALTLMIPLAVGLGVLVAAVPWRSRGVAAAVGVAAIAATAVLQLVGPGPVLAREPDGWLRSDAHAAQVDGAGAYLGAHYDGGRVLAAFFGSEYVLFSAHIDPGHGIDEGSFHEWRPALHDPVGHQVAWIVMRADDPTDPVFATLNGAPTLSDDYRKVYDADGYRIYRRR